MTADGRRRARGRPRTFDRDHTLEVAIDSYWRDGVHQTSVNEICRRAGISKPSLYREFGGEDQLMDAALTRYRETVLEPLLATLREDRPFRETLQSLIDYITRPATPSVPAGCLFATMRNARSAVGPTTGEHIDALRAGGIAAYGDWLRRSAERGEIELPTSLPRAAQYVDAQLTLLVTQAGAGEDREYLREQAVLAFAAFQPDAPAQR